MKITRHLKQYSLIDWVRAGTGAILLGLAGWFVLVQAMPEVFSQYPWLRTLTTVVFATGGFFVGLNLTHAEDKTEQVNE